jgi:hypothetical protein
MTEPDDLDEYLRGDSELSRHYRMHPKTMPPRAVDRQVLHMARRTQGKSPCLAPLALAASVLLSLGLVLAILLNPRAPRRVDDAPRMQRIAHRMDADAAAPLGRTLQLYSSDPTQRRERATWRANIDALRRAGRTAEADAEDRRFRRVYQLPSAPLPLPDGQ